MPGDTAALKSLLRLTLTPGLGPILLRRVIAACGSTQAACHASQSQLESVDGIGPTKARTIAQGLRQAEEAADREWELAAKLNVGLLPFDSPGFPGLLASLPDAPALLYVRGNFDADLCRFPVAIVGSRDCTAYGLAQASRFAGALAQSGLTIVSGGARGIDTAAHRAALQVGGRTIAVLGCGLAHVYPEENIDLFNRVATTGAVVSELPLNTPPSAENFPARNRIISGLSLGVLVVEAGRQSGALITARVAAEDHGREVMALPGRVDAPQSAGALTLIKEGGAALVTEPADVIHVLESAARHQSSGTHGARYSASLFTPAEPDAERSPTQREERLVGIVSEAQRAILEALESPGTLDTVCQATELDASTVLRELTQLEIQRRIRRSGGMLQRVD